ncbi:MAG TPA: hypothetical protein VJM08_11750 [Anaerolineales bacterium]|nr:hypothetical protein [Anaerolineales bacterium]
MTRDTQTDGEVHEKDLYQVFREIREEVEKAQSHEELTELYKRTGYMITMTHATPVKEKSDRDLKRRRDIAEREFSRTVHAINKRAKEIGVEADYSEQWNGLASNDYQPEPEDENLLEAQTMAENKLTKK